MQKTLRAVALLRAFIPYGHDFSDPLMQYEMRPQLRAGKRPWTQVLMSYLILSLLAIFFAYNLRTATTREPLTLSDLIGASSGILLFGMGLMMAVGHWQLLFAVLGRTTAMLAARRGRGDWELIFITPVPKARWFLAQLTALGWQVWRMTRRLVVLQGVMVMIGFGWLIYLQHGLHGQGVFGSSRVFASSTLTSSDRLGYLPTPLYALAILPFALLLVFEPIITGGLFAQVGLWVSSRTKQSTMALLGSLLGVYLVRVWLMLVLFYGGIIISIGVSLLAQALGLISSSSDFSASGQAVFYLLIFPLIYALVGAFFLEWLPIFAPIVLLLEMKAGEYLTVYVILLLTFGLSYVLAPLRIMHILGRQTVRQLEKRET